MLPARSPALTAALAVSLVTLACGDSQGAGDDAGMTEGTGSTGTAGADLLLRHRSPDTPVVLGRDVGGSGERVRVVRLAELDPSEVDMRTLLIVGSSQTRALDRGDNGTPVVFTPRRYP